MRRDSVVLWGGIIALAISFVPGALRLFHLLGELETDYLIHRRRDGSRYWRKV